MNFDLTQLKALIFDVDGTLYRQNLLRSAMLVRLLTYCIKEPIKGIKTFRALRAYRKAQEVIRQSSGSTGDIAQLQIQLACDWTGLDFDFINSCVSLWMEQIPLRVLADVRYQPAGLLPFLQSAEDRGLKLGVLSDYPAAAKLSAMGIAHYFDAICWAQDPDVQSFKPNSRGFEVLLKRLRVEKSAVLYIGDRPEIDALAARNFGVPCVIIGKPHSQTAQGNFILLSSYNKLYEYLFSSPLLSCTKGSLNDFYCF